MEMVIDDEGHGQGEVLIRSEFGDDNPFDGDQIWYEDEGGYEYMSVSPEEYFDGI